jgi:hypothetical protein
MAFTLAYPCVLHAVTGEATTGNVTVDTRQAYLTLQSSTGGQISGAGGYTVGSNATITAAPALGYVFTGWTGDISAITNPLTLTMNTDKSVGATFAQDSRDLDGDGLTNYQELIDYHTNPLVADTDADSYSDSYELENSSNPLDGDSLPTYQLTLSDGGIVTGGSFEYTGNLAHGTNATLSATPATGYVFSGWTGDALGTNNLLSLLMNSNKIVGAIFAADTSDADGDGLNNYLELVVYGTSTTSSDSDGDGLSDAWEVGLGRFSIILGSFTWSQARVDAQARGGDLACFPTQIVWERMLESLDPTAFDDFTGLWIGASDAAQEGAWTWVNGAPFSFSAWASTRPIRIATNTLDHVELSGGAGAEILKWYDRSATTIRDGFLLEMGRTTSPTMADADGDGLNDGQEQTAKTHPGVADTDGDGLKDGDEVNLTQTNPLAADSDGDTIPDSNEDTDGDGLTNYQELIDHGTNPNLADSNNDGLQDGLALDLGKNPNENHAAFVQTILTKRGQLGLRTDSDITDLRAGSMSVQRAAGSNKLQIRMKLQKSSNLLNWQDDGEAVFEADVEPTSPKLFYRFGVE